MKRLYSSLNRNRIAPRWAIFVFDLLICNLALFQAFELRFDYSMTERMEHLLFFSILLITVINAFFFISFKTYEGIIRFSGLKEAIRTGYSILYSFLFVLLLNFVFRITGNTDLIPTSILTIYFFIATMLIVGYRYMVKNLYTKSLQHKNSTNVVIFGGEHNGSMLKRTLEQAGKNNYHVVGFMEDDERYINKSIDGVKIYTFEQIKHVIKAWQIKTVFFAKQDFDLSLKNTIVDYCLEHNIQVKNLPPVTEWIHGQLNLNKIEEVKIEDLLNRPAIRLANAHVNAYLKSRRILITGAAGSIGSEIARQVAALYPQAVILCDQTESALFDLEYDLGQEYGRQTEMVSFIGDVRDRKAMNQLFARYRPDVVFHAAAYKHVPLMEQHPSEAIKNNVQGTMVLADMAEKYYAERFLFVSTDKAINPTNVMGASKRIAEMYVQSMQYRELPLFIQDNGLLEHTQEAAVNRRRTKFITTRFGNVLGSNGSVIPRFKQQIAKGGPITVTHPDIIRYFMTIPEACNLVLEAASMGNGGEVFLFDMGAPVKIVDLANKMIKLAGRTPGKEIKIEFTGLRPGEKLFEELLNNQEEVLPTHHKKILVAKLAHQQYEVLEEKLKSLLSMANGKAEDVEVVQMMKQIVPEFKSKNSVYEKIDRLSDESLETEEASVVL